MGESYFDSFQEIISNIINFLENFASAIKRFQDWYRENADTITAYVEAFADFGIWCCAVQKLGEHQIIFTDDLSLELAKEVYHSKDVSTVIENYYFDPDRKNVDALIARCKQSKLISSYYIDLYSQIVSAINMEHYHLACIGLFSVIDGVLADVSQMITETNFKKRFEAIKNKLSDKIELENIDKKLWCVFASIDSVKDSFFQNCSFAQDEPSLLNRNWVLHGRTRKEYSRQDILKELLMLDAIIFLSNSCE